MSTLYLTKLVHYPGQRRPPRAILLCWSSHRTAINCRLNMQTKWSSWNNQIDTNFTVNDCQISDIFPVCSSNPQSKINATTFVFAMFCKACHTHFKCEIVFLRLKCLLLETNCKTHDWYDILQNVFTSYRKSPHLSMCLISLRPLSYLKSFREAIEGITDIILCRIIQLPPSTKTQ